MEICKIILNDEHSFFNFHYWYRLGSSLASKKGESESFIEEIRDAMINPSYHKKALASY